MVLKNAVRRAVGFIAGPPHPIFSKSHYSLLSSADGGGMTMTAYLLLATTDGLGVYAREAAGWRAVRKGLASRRVTCVLAREGVILAGSQAGVWRSDDLGESWRAANAGLTQPYVRWLAFHPDISDFEVAGTEPAGIFVSRDGDARWREWPQIGQPRDTPDWF